MQPLDYIATFENKRYVKIKKFIDLMTMIAHQKQTSEWLKSNSTSTFTKIIREHYGINMACKAKR